MAKIKVKKMGRAEVKNKFTSFLLKDHKEKAKILADFFEEISKELLGGTIQGISGYQGFLDAEVKVDKPIIVSDKQHGVSIKLHSYMGIQGSNEPHPIWHIVNAGRPAIHVNKLTIFRPAKFARTKPFSLKVRSGGAKEEKVAMRPGDVISGFKGREFYFTAFLQIIKKLDEEGNKVFIVNRTDSKFKDK